MSRLQTLTHRARRRTTTGRPLLTLALVAACAGLAAVASSTTAAPQSGRRTPGSVKREEPTPSATPEATGESESKSRSEKKKPVGLTFIVSQFNDPFLDVAYVSPVDLIDAFARRISDSKAAEVVRGPQLSRQEARERAKNERDAFLVLVAVEDVRADSGRGTIGQVNPRALAMRFYVYEPRTAQIKYQDRFVQRPYTPTAKIGGIRIPVPAPRTSIPTRDEIEQLARDAADHLLMRFGIRPPEN